MGQMLYNTAPTINAPPPSECPMHASNSTRPLSESNSTIPYKTLTGCPMAFNTSSSESEACSNSSTSLDPSNLMPSPNQQPSPNQPFPLSTSRKLSTIPRYNTKDEFWEYPSEQMFFNAMVRKGWHWTEDKLQEGDMMHVINIHNTNNERTWREILKWEALHGSKTKMPHLVSFRGRAKDYSPRARIRNLLGYELPFDRHDWIIDRAGKKVRYVIDYYGCDKANENDMPEIYTDVRPALDSPLSLWHRIKVTCMRWRYGNV